MSGPDDFDTGILPGQLDQEHPRPVETPWGTMALYRFGEEVLCVQAFCPHLEGPLFQGTLTFPGAEAGPDPQAQAGPAVTCPWHRWRYDLRTGERLWPTTGERPEGPLVRCEVVRGERGTVWLRRPRP